MNQQLQRADLAAIAANIALQARCDLHEHIVLGCWALHHHFQGLHELHSLDDPCLGLAHKLLRIGQVSGLEHLVQLVTKPFADLVISASLLDQSFCASVWPTKLL